MSDFKWPWTERQFCAAMVAAGWTYYETLDLFGEKHPGVWRHKETGVSFDPHKKNKDGNEAWTECARDRAVPTEAPF